MDVNNVEKAVQAVKGKVANVDEACEGLVAGSQKFADQFRAQSESKAIKLKAAVELRRRQIDELEDLKRQAETKNELIESDNEAMLREAEHSVQQFEQEIAAAKEETTRLLVEREAVRRKRITLRNQQHEQQRHHETKVVLIENTMKIKITHETDDTISGCILKGHPQTFEISKKEDQVASAGWLWQMVCNGIPEKELAKVEKYLTQWR